MNRVDVSQSKAATALAERRMRRAEAALAAARSDLVSKTEASAAAQRDALAAQATLAKAARRFAALSGSDRLTLFERYEAHRLRLARAEHSAQRRLDEAREIERLARQAVATARSAVAKADVKLDAAQDRTRRALRRQQITREIRQADDRPQPLAHRGGGSW